MFSARRRQNCWASESARSMALFPPGFEASVIRREGGMSLVVGSTTARVKLGYEEQILPFTVVRDKVETRLGLEVMEPHQFHLSLDRLHGTLYISGTTRVGVWDPRVGEPRTAH